MRQDEGRLIPPGDRPPITVRYPGANGNERKTFERPFRIGRDEECDVRISSASVSRVHAEVVYENNSWWLIDLHSSNGTFHSGERIDRVRIRSDETLSFSKTGPEIRLTIGDRAGVIPREPSSRGRAAHDDDGRSGGHERTMRDDAGGVENGRRESSGSIDSGGQPGEDLSLEEYVEHYLSADSSQPAGEHTIMIRRAFQTVQKKQQKHHFATIAAVIGVALVIATVSVVFIYRAEKQRERAEQQAVAVFNRIKELDIKIKKAALASGSAALLSELGIEEEWQNLNNEYDQYVTEFGIRRRLNEKERAIYTMARVFNETEIEIPPGFVKEVNKTINDFWLKTARGKFENGIRRAEQSGYTPRIVRTLHSYGLPPEFFYLALQESDFNTNAVGWETRWGFAKGMWQFIPATAERYGLRVGPLKDRKMPDPADDRH
ncbi:MAG: FHA domain-containing protein, partial [Rhodothermia bacterium]|nr:FHA domain-containing protein [Rhodothermia bacterium]